MTVKPIPDGYHSITPYLIVRDAARALDFYKKAFGAVELLRMAHPTGKIGHAEIKIGDSIIMMADEFPDHDIRSPESFGGSPVSLLLYVEDVDTAFPQAIAAGGTVVKPIADQFYGDRSGMLKDPFGHTWSISTHKEDLTPEQVQQRISGTPQ
jgi:PhnB protein